MPAIALHLILCVKCIVKDRHIGALKGEKEVNMLCACILTFDYFIHLIYLAFAGPLYPHSQTRVPSISCIMVILRSTVSYSRVIDPGKTYFILPRTL